MKIGALFEAEGEGGLDFEDGLRVDLGILGMGGYSQEEKDADILAAQQARDTAFNTETQTLTAIDAQEQTEGTL